MVDQPKGMEANVGNAGIMSKVLETHAQMSFATIDLFRAFYLSLSLYDTLYGANANNVKFTMAAT